MEPVECFITIVTGAPGHGKSKRSKETLKMYVLNDIAKGRKGRPVLIHDTNNEYGEFKPILYNVDDPADNGKYFALHKRPEIRRVEPFTRDRRPMTFEQKVKTLQDIMTYFRNGLVLVEDINTYIDKFNDLDIISFLCNSRHRGLDIVIHLQSLSAVATRMWQNARIVRFHYQSDDITRYRGRIPNFELMKIAQNIVNKEYFGGNQYYYLFVDIRANKIIGVNKMQFVQGCMEYVNKFMGKEIKQEMEAFKISRNEAVKKIIANKMKIYLPR